MCVTALQGFIFRSTGEEMQYKTKNVEGSKEQSLASTPGREEVKDTPAHLTVLFIACLRQPNMSANQKQSGQTASILWKLAFQPVARCRVLFKIK